MKGGEPVRAKRISAIRLNVANIERAVAFYEAGLGFAVEKRDVSAVTMSLGGEKLELIQALPCATPYPVAPAANDPWFQHFAIRVSDMPAAYARLMQQQQTPISTGGPQQLPPSTGSVIAYKFRDPDGHPLELTFVPQEGRLQAASPLFLTIDHTALAVADIERSLAFWVGLLGLRETARLLNQGPTQWRLDGLDGALVDIVVLEPAAGGPHVELLHYRNPISAKSLCLFGPKDIVATTLRMKATSTLDNGDGLRRLEAQGEDQDSFVLRDPDGHHVQLST